MQYTMESLSKCETQATEDVTGTCQDGDESESDKKTKRRSKIETGIYIVFWMFASAIVVFFNSHILRDADFHYSIFLTYCHMVFATIITQILAHCSSLLDTRAKINMTPSGYFRTIGPIAIYFSASLVLSNTAFMLISVPFIQMIKAFTPAGVLLASYLIMGKTITKKIALNILIIISGICLASFGEVQFNILGFLSQVFSIFFQGCKMVQMSRLLFDAREKMDPMVSLFYFAPACAFMLAIYFVIFELKTFQLEALFRLGFLKLFLNSAASFVLNVASVVLMKRVSSLRMTLFGITKDIIIVMVSSLFFNTRVTVLQVIGYMIALGGLIYYKLDAAKV